MLKAVLIIGAAAGVLYFVNRWQMQHGAAGQLRSAANCLEQPGEAAYHMTAATNDISVPGDPESPITVCPPAMNAASSGKRRGFCR